MGTRSRGGGFASRGRPSEEQLAGLWHGDQGDLVVALVSVVGQTGRPAAGGRVDCQRAIAGDVLIPVDRGKAGRLADEGHGLAGAFQVERAG